MKLTSAFLITAAGGVALDKMNFELPETIGPVAWATLIGGFVILGIEYWKKEGPGNRRVTWGIAVACGIAQLVAAVFPGTSRSGATIMVAIALGLARSEAAEFSFILGMITLTAAGGYKLLGAWRHGEVAGANLTDVMLGFAVAAVASFLVVRWLLQFVRSHSFNGLPSTGLLWEPRFYSGVPA